jgi:hypothetical protein
MKTGVIAFCGSKFSGKSTSATMLKDLFQGETEELAFAGHLKEVCSKAFNVEMKYFLDPSLKEVELQNYVTLTDENVEVVFKLFEVSEYTYDKNIRPHLGQVFDTPRSLLQYIGTEVLHPIDPLIHAKITMKKKDPAKLSIITDLRFFQEFEFLLAQPEFLPVYVSNKTAESNASGDTHKSETDLKKFKHLCRSMDNNSDLENLRNGIKKLVDESLT